MIVKKYSNVKILIRKKQHGETVVTVFMQVLPSETSEEKHKGDAALCSCNMILFIHSTVLDFDEVWIHWNANYFTKWCKAFMFYPNPFIVPGRKTKMQ